MTSYGWTTQGFLLMHQQPPTSSTLWMLNWLRVWDLALDHGPNGTSYALAMLKLLGLQSFSGNCPFSSREYNLGKEHLGSHFLSIHTELSVTLSDCDL